ncbi:hypothetical protein SFR_7038 (plasmid) [Streptomyces sp. FR-008]|nr:hypothetical protein SFR_7038 [Streptomyces sp. FR-008]
MPTKAGGAGGAPAEVGLQDEAGPVRLPGPHGADRRVGGVGDLGGAHGVLGLAGEDGDDQAALLLGDVGDQEPGGVLGAGGVVEAGGVVGGDLGGDGVGEVLGLGQALGGLHAVPGRPPFHEGLALGGGRVPRCGRCTVGLWGGAVIRSPAGPGRR